MFVSNLQSNNVGNVIEFPGGAMPGTALTGVSLNLPGTPVFDASNNLIISDWGRATIDVFAPPYSGSPTTSPLMGASIWCPLGHNQARIFCGDAENGSIDVYAYPGATYLYSNTGGLSPSALVTGVAPSPAAPFLSGRKRPGTEVEDYLLLQPTFDYVRRAVIRPATRCAKLDALWAKT
ncbi:MAG: hypothetical protein ABI346_07625 [Candidatus Baltobacteraceae bacterium]